MIPFSKYLHFHIFNPEYALGERSEGEKGKKIKWFGNFGIAPLWWNWKYSVAFYFEAIFSCNSFSKAESGFYSIDTPDYLQTVVLS